MKYLYYPPDGPIYIKFKKKNNEQIIEEEHNTLKPYFKLAETNAYEFILVKCAGLYYKTSKNSTQRTNLHGFINILEYNHGGNYNADNTFTI